MNNCFSIILLLFTLITNFACQNSRFIQSEATKSKQIALSDILGDWHSIDTLTASKITFRQIGNSSVEIDGIKHGVGNYIFSMEGDSISVDGTAANWPPYYCTLRLLNSNLLEIESYHYNPEETSKFNYKR